LVKWKRYKTELFTNVAFLKEVEIKSHKSRRLKELVILFLRLLAFAALILAFAKPFKPSKADSGQVTTSQNIIYLDNSLSMGAMDGKTTIWQNYIQDLQQNIPDKGHLTLLTNDKIYRDINVAYFKKLLNKIDFSFRSTKHTQNFKKISFLFDNQSNVKKNILYCSDLQQVYNETLSDSLLNSAAHYYFLAHTQKEFPNISIDSIWQTESGSDFNRFILKVSANRSELKSPVSITASNKVLWQSYLDFKDSLSQRLQVNIPVQDSLAGTVSIADNGFQFDNTLYFNLPKIHKNKILFIGKILPEFIKKIYTPDEFVLEVSTNGQFDINKLPDYDLIILNRSNLPDSYINLLNKYVNDKGNLLILPGDWNTDDFARLLNKFHVLTEVRRDTSKVFLNKINFKQPFFKDVFTKPVSNFAYPYVKTHYRFTNLGSWLYRLSDQSPFAQIYFRKGKIFVINSPVNTKNTNFTEAASLVVPLFYQMGKDRQRSQQLYYVLGEKNQISIPVSMAPDETIHLKNQDFDMIPYQENHHRFVSITTTDLPKKAGIYDVVYQNKTIGKLAFNYNRKENKLQFLKLPENQSVEKISSIKTFWQSEQNFFKSRQLWLWFLWAALLFLIVEMLLLRFWKV
jgi:hypothetical protein